MPVIASALEGPLLLPPPARTRYRCAQTQPPHVHPQGTALNDWKLKAAKEACLPGQGWRHAKLLPTKPHRIRRPAPRSTLGNAPTARPATSEECRVTRHHRPRAPTAGAQSDLFTDTVLIYQRPRKEKLMSVISKLLAGAAGELGKEAVKAAQTLLRKRGYLADDPTGQEFRRELSTPYAN